MAITFAMRGEYIQLDQLLKVTDLCASGGVAHHEISAGNVKVDGVVELRKRAKLRPGQKIEFEGETVTLTPHPGGSGE